MHGFFLKSNRWPRPLPPIAQNGGATDNSIALAPTNMFPTWQCYQYSWLILPVVGWFGTINYNQHATMPLGSRLALKNQMYPLWKEHTDPAWIVVIPRLWQNDCHVMEVILQFNLSLTQLQQINACCMYLQITTLVEILDHTGTHLLPQAVPDTDFNPSNFRYSVNHCYCGQKSIVPWHHAGSYRPWQSETSSLTQDKAPASKNLLDLGFQPTALTTS